MPYTVIYEEAPRCTYCGKKMESWIMFAEIHYHDECRLKACMEEIDKKIKLFLNSINKF